MDNIKIEIYNTPVKRLKDGKVFNYCYVPHPELGSYSTAMELVKQGHCLGDVIDKEVVDLNPTRFTYLN